MLKTLNKIYYKGLDYITTKSFSSEDDEYWNWLQFANSGMIHKGNIYSMNYAIERLCSDKPILEIGSWCGLSINIMNYLLYTKNKGNKIISCDKWLYEGYENENKLCNSNILHKEYRAFAKASFIRNVKFFSKDNLPYTIEHFSDDFFKLYKKEETVKDVFDRSIKLGGNISFSYIDGNHTYDFTKRDFENVDQILDVGGFILFDDSSDENVFGLKKLMKEICQRSDYELVMKNPNYLFRKNR